MAPERTRCPPRRAGGRIRAEEKQPGPFRCCRRLPLFPSQSASLTAPLALSRFLRRAAAGACKNRSAAPGCRYPNWRRARGALANLDGCPCSSSAVSAAGSASLTQPLTAPCFCHWQRSLFVPPRGEPSVPPSNTVNCTVRQSCEQVCLTTSWPPPTGVHLPRPVGEVAQDAPADCDGEGNRPARLRGPTERSLHDNERLL